VTRKKTSDGNETRRLSLKFIKRRTLLLASAWTFALSPSLAASVFSGVDTSRKSIWRLEQVRALGMA
jgi:hypothetical protein